MTTIGLAGVAAAHPDPVPAPPLDEAAAASDDDLAQAADATAEVAAMQPSETEPSPAAAADDIDLSSLGLDPAGETVDDKLNIYGFADMEFLSSRLVRPDPVYPSSKSFSFGNLNLYLSKTLTPRARTLAEVGFTFLPNGSLTSDYKFVSTTAYDLKDAYRPVQWGGIVIERAYLDFDINEHLTVRAGRWLTPYGIWNIDHGSPVIVGVRRPYIVGEEFFPAHQTGVQLFGSQHRDGFTLDYVLTVSNGRGGAEAQLDLDQKFAFGGRLELKTPWGVRVGGSYYRGRYTGLPESYGQEGLTFFEVAYGGDVQIDHGGWHAQAEGLVRERAYIDGQRPPLVVGAPVYTPDGRDLGFYVLGGYRFDRLWNVMPYLVNEEYEPANLGIASPLRVTHLGLNFRPAPSVVFKAQVARTKFDDDGSFLAGNRIHFFSTQASWLF